jgi:hypothetical protein
VSITGERRRPGPRAARAPGDSVSCRIASMLISTRRPPELLPIPWNFPTGQNRWCSAWGDGPLRRTNPRPRAERSQSPAPTESNPARRPKPIPVTGRASAVPRSRPKSRYTNAIRSRNAGAPTEPNSCRKTVLRHPRSRGMTAPERPRTPRRAKPIPGAERTRRPPFVRYGAASSGTGGCPIPDRHATCLSKSIPHHRKSEPQRSSIPRRGPPPPRPGSTRTTTGRSSISRQTYGFSDTDGPYREPPCSQERDRG